MPLNEEVKALIGDKFTEDALAEMLTPEVQTRLTAGGHIIRTADEDNSFVSQRAKELKDAEIGTHVGTLHQMYEDQIKELGYAKKANEKTSEFQKRILADLKLKADHSTGGDEVLRQQIQTLTANLESERTAKDTEVTTLKEQYFKRQVDGLLSAELGGRTLALPGTVKTDQDKQAFAETQKGLLKLQLLNNYTVKEDNDGNVAFYKGDVLQSSTKDGKPLSAGDIISRDFGSYFEAPKNAQGGAGSSGQGNASGNFATRKDVYEHLEANGYESGSNRLTQEATKIIKEQGILK